jgi:hypothetical protein
VPPPSIEPDLSRLATFPAEASRAVHLLASEARTLSRGRLVTLCLQYDIRFGQPDHRQRLLRPPQTHSQLDLTIHRLRVLPTECFEWMADRTAINVK